MNPLWLLALLAFSHFAFTVLPVDAATQTITATHTYVMGDNDSRNDARRLCFLEAKRKVLEQAGTFIQSSSEVKNFELTKDQITSYSAAILSVETIQESYDSRNGQNTLTLTVKNPALPGGAFVNQEGIYLRFATSCHSSPLFRAGHPGRSS